MTKIFDPEIPEDLRFLKDLVWVCPDVELWFRYKDTDAYYEGWEIRKDNYLTIHNVTRPIEFSPIRLYTVGEPDEITDATET